MDLHDQIQDWDLVNQLKDDFQIAQLSPADHEMLKYATKLTVRPAAVSDSDLQHLREVGFDDEGILEIVHITAYFNYINRVADGLGIDPEPEWEREALE